MSAAATTRNLIAPLVRWGYRLRVHGAHRCPRRGPLLIVAPLRGFLDPTIIATCLPRPVDVLVDPGGLSALGGQIPGRIVVHPDDPGPGLREAVAVLQGGGAVGAWVGEGHERGAGLLIARTGATVLPVFVLGGSGRHPGDPPRWRARIDVVVGEPWSVRAPADPLSRADILSTAEVIRQRVVDHATLAGRRLGTDDGVGLPGPQDAPDNGAL